MILPNIASGHILSGIGTRNFWQTSIMAAVFHASEWSYLSHECRAEAISPSNIFEGHVYDFRVLVTPTCTFAMRTGAYLVPMRGQPSAALERARFISEVRTEFVNSKSLGFSEALEECRRGLMWLHIEFGQTILICPASYVNFPSDGQAYLQPQAGPVPLLINGKWRLAYIAAYLTKEGTKLLQFICNSPVGILSSKPATSRLRRLPKLFDHIFKIDAYHEVTTVEGTVKFFQY